jgi:hypothetical protein
MNRLHNILIWGALALLPAVPAAADGAGTIKFDEESFEVNEEAGVASIRIERSQGEDGSASIRFSTGGGTAAAGQDYTAVSQTLSWGPATARTGPSSSPSSTTPRPKGWRPFSSR